jgi:cytochrome P450
MIRSAVELKRTDPADDLITELVAGGEFSDDELVGMGMFLIGAGHHTTANQFALGLFALLTDRAQWTTLLEDRSLVDGAVEELLRYLTILQLGTSTRTATEDVQVGGGVIRKGDHVAVSLLAANRDPRAFAEPNCLDLRRGARGHLAFGHGIHMCLGQHLARMELQVGFAALLDRFPGLRLAAPLASISMHPPDADVYGPNQLPVRW